MLKYPVFTSVLVAGFLQTFASNPLLVHSNTPLPFDKVDAKTVKDAVASVIQSSDERIKNIIAIPAGKQSVANTLLAMDEVEYNLSDLQSKLGVITATYEDDSTRTTAN